MTENSSFGIDFYLLTILTRYDRATGLRHRTYLKALSIKLSSQVRKFIAYFFLTCYQNHQ
ncbi:hypothetical protein [Nostoc parmelioides]|uniref:Uncharacterized protein n=1 Tax=Nostoc parmelioides FACHB-3921 TaxID=2692909 RepID=A0ABR8BRV0_9NOSO|nr:hypothetical protein [Nostoc parmelioides]MBD2255668.1 hypothetical protein [Nostoc parmelioides FACHB-3921]